MGPRLSVGLLLGLIAIICGVLIHEASQSTEAEMAAAPFAVIPVAKAQQAPDFTLKTTDGQMVKLSDEVNGGPVLLDFWATWCGPCKMELPELAAVSKRYEGQGVKFNGINSDASSAQIKAFFSNASVGFPILVDKDAAVYHQYGITAIPAVIVVDRHRMVRSVDIGYDPTTQRDLSKSLDILLEEQ